MQILFFYSFFFFLLNPSCPLTQENVQMVLSIFSFSHRSCYCYQFLLSHAWISWEFSLYIWHVDFIVFWALGSNSYWVNCSSTSSFPLTLMPVMSVTEQTTKCIVQYQATAFKAVAASPSRATG